MRAAEAIANDVVRGVVLSRIIASSFAKQDRYEANLLAWIMPAMVHAVCI